MGGSSLSREVDLVRGTGVDAPAGLEADDPLVVGWVSVKGTKVPQDVWGGCRPQLILTLDRRGCWLARIFQIAC